MRVAFGSLDELPNLSWEAARARLVDDLTQLQRTINTTWDVAHNVDGTQRSSFVTLSGIVWGTLAQQPTGLSVVNDKLLYFVTDYGHLVYWDGSASLWKFAPGDTGNGFIRDYAITPQEVGWVLCNGAGTTYLTVGATLSSAAFTTPNLTGSPAYRKAGAAYTGAINAGGSTGAAAPGTDSQGSHSHSGATGTGSPNLTDGPNLLETVDNDNLGSTVTVARNTHAHGLGGHTHSISADGSHSHTVNSHTHTAGDPSNIVMLPYFRR